MSDFVNIRAVIKPRRFFVCDWCEHALLSGPHVYMAGISDYDFVSVRYCLKCARANRPEESLTDREKAVFEKVEKALLARKEAREAQKAATT